MLIDVKPMIWPILEEPITRIKYDDSCKLSVKKLTKQSRSWAPAKTILDRIQGVRTVLCTKLTASAEGRSSSLIFNPSWTSVKDTTYEANKSTHWSSVTWLPHFVEVVHVNTA